MIKIILNKIDMLIINKKDEITHLQPYIGDSIQIDQLIVLVKRIKDNLA